MLSSLQWVLLLAAPAAVFAVFEQNARRGKEAATPTPKETVDTASTATTTTTTAAVTTAMALPVEAPATAKQCEPQQLPEMDRERGAGGEPTAARERSRSARPKILIAYASHSRNALSLSHKLFTAINAELAERQSMSGSGAGTGSGGDGGGAVVVTPTVHVLELREEESHACSVDTLLESDVRSESFYSLIVFVVSTFTDGAAPPRSHIFDTVLKDTYEDHRVPRDALSTKRFALFGLGDTAYGEANFNAFGRRIVAHCRGMGAPNFVVPPVFATEAKVSNLFHVFSQTLLKWLARAEFLSDKTIRVQRRRVGPTAPATGEAADANAEANGRHAAESDGSDGDGGDSAVDEIEDLIDDIEPHDDDGDDDSGGPKELLNPRLRKNLERQGYGLIGSHSGVKLCRWTKAMLRGRGGCYKHTFYNINSSQCMELTPSLACANKCVFCWRHHTNPVATSFRWKVDEPLAIVQGGISEHVRMMKAMRGVPGVSEEAFQKALTVKHCALSLVGEPIMYPRVNEFLQLLHAPERRVSSFMVTNAQFPEQLRALRPVTQLYLSIDAPTPEELKRIDRPLFEDYWERCLRCVEVLRRKRNTRTVFRLTLVNEMNNDNIASYADLVERGWPDFIEVKGVTFCGTSHTNTIHMKTHVPRHDEVIAFCSQLCAEVARRRPNYVTHTMNEAAAAAEEQKDGVAEGEEEEGHATVIIPLEERNRPYHIACEHEHSCCVLIALDKFYFAKRWNTWIDYDKFFQLAAKYDEVHGVPAAPGVDSTDKDTEVGEAENTAGETFTFSSLDYCAPTPSWAVYRSAERGFDPAQTRVLRKNSRPSAPTEPQPNHR